jgi:LacI family transcriptional regulator
MTMPTRNDVARIARVSSATVSRAFNNPGSVSDDKAKRVLNAAAKLGYVPDKNASALRRSGTGTIMFLERKPGDDPSSDERFYRWFYADIIRAVKSVIDASMYQLSLHSYSSIDDIRAIKRRPAADGIICYSMTDPREISSVKSLNIPYVVCRQMEPAAASYNTSYIDEIHGGMIAGQELARTGHRNPAHITGNLSSIAICRARWAGFQQAFPGKAPLLIDGELGIKGGYQSGMKAVPLVREGKVDGVFVVNDLTAIGVIHALLASGVRIPQDVSIVGYDNLPFIGTLPFALTTVEINLSRAYLEGARLLMQSIRDGSAIRNRVLPEIVEGESVQRR